MLTLKDKRLIHRVIDIEFDDCRRRRKQRKITEQLREDKEKRDELRNAIQETDALENERAKQNQPSKAVDEVTKTKTETEKAPETP